MSALGAAVPALDDGVHLVGPRHGARAAGDIHYHHRLTRCCKRLNQSILAVGQDNIFAVRAFVVLVFALVETADEKDAGSILGRCHRRGRKLLSATAVGKILASDNLVVNGCGVAYVAALPDHIGLAVEGLVKGVQRNHLVLGFEVGGAAAHHHHLVGVLAHYQEFTALRDLQRQGAVVLEEHKAVGSNLARCGEMLGRGETAEVLLRSHGGAEDGSEDAGGLVVQTFLAGAAVAEALQVRLGQMIIAITV